MLSVYTSKNTGATGVIRGSQYCFGVKVVEIEGSGPYHGLAGGFRISVSRALVYAITPHSRDFR